MIETSGLPCCCDIFEFMKCHTKARAGTSNNQTMASQQLAKGLPLVPMSRVALQSITSCRPGETKVGETLRLLTGESVDGGCDMKQLQQDLKLAKQSNCRFAILGVPEDVGPRANLGRGGANSGWGAFLPWFVNMQHVSKQFEGNSALLLGHVQCGDLQSAASSLPENPSEKTKVLRQLVEQLDERVESVVKEVFDAGLELVS
jgi:formiminoglutamase